MAVAPRLALLGLGIDGEDRLVVDFGEGVVAVVVEQEMLGGADRPGGAVETDLVLGVAAEDVILGQVPLP